MTSKMSRSTLLKNLGRGSNISRNSNSNCNSNSNSNSNANSSSSSSSIMGKRIALQRRLTEGRLEEMQEEEKQEGDSVAVHMRRRSSGPVYSRAAFVTSCRCV